MEPGNGAPSPRSAAPTANLLCFCSDLSDIPGAQALLQLVRSVQEGTFPPGVVDLCLKGLWLADSDGVTRALLAHQQPQPQPRPNMLHQLQRLELFDWPLTADTASKLSEGGYSGWPRHISSTCSSATWIAHVTPPCTPLGICEPHQLCVHSAMPQASNLLTSPRDTAMMWTFHGLDTPWTFHGLICTTYKTLEPPARLTMPCDALHHTHSIAR